MKLHEFITDVIAPKATEAVFKQNSGGEIGIGAGNPKFENLTTSKKAMIEIYKKVTDEVVAEYKINLDKAFYEHKTLVFLTRGLGQEGDKSVEVKVQTAQQKVEKAFKDYKLAMQANEYVKNFVL